MSLISSDVKSILYLTWALQDVSGRFVRFGRYLSHYLSRMPRHWCTSCVDFSNSVLYDVTTANIHSLQSVLNTAGRLGLKLRKFDRVSISTITRNKLHRLPVDQRIIYKFCLLAYKCQHEQTPSYLSSLCAPLSAATTRRHVRAATQGDLDFPRTRTVTYGSRAFAVSGSTCWNALPPSLKSPSLKSAQFCSLLKTTLMAQPSLLFVTRFARL